jgi:trk system potassium uptake protein TrkH
MLSLAVRKRVVVWLLGQLLIPLAGMAVFPVFLALAFGEYEFALICAAVSAVFLVAGWAMARIEAPLDVRYSEGIVAIVIVFLIGATAMALPFVAEGLPWLDAWFESVSAITTTGLTTLGDVESRSLAFLFTRAWMQWYGGLVIVVLAVALVLAPGPAAQKLGETQVEAFDVVGGTRARARQALAVYLALTSLAFVLLVLAGVAPFDALCHALAAVSTGGFSSHNDGLRGLGGLQVQWIPIAMSFCGAISLTLYMRAWQGRWRDVIWDPGLRGLVIAILASTLLISIFMMTKDDLPWTYVLRHAPLLAVSAQTTSGFSSIDVGALDPASKLTLIGSMFVGGESGSTAGGIKIARLLILLALIRFILTRVRMPPHAVTKPLASGRRLGESDVYAGLTVVILHALVISLSWLIFVASGHGVLNALFEVTSAVGTVGLSTGVTNASLAPWLKGLLTADMLMGRLEVVAVIVLLNPMTWFGRRAEVS